MKKFACLILALFSSQVLGFSQERISVVDNSEECAIKDVLRQAVRAFDAEDIRAYESCFRESRKKTIRKNTAMAFAEDECSMELIDAHVISVEDGSASVAVKYKMARSSNSCEFVSEIYVIKEGDKWVIDRELVKKSLGNSYATTSVRRGGAAEPKKEWDPYNPDPNKISPTLHHLMGDIGIREGFGCSDGKCANGRCQK